MVRQGKNFKGWALGLLLRTAGKGVLQRAFEGTVKAIEARNYAIEVKTTETGERNRITAAQHVLFPRVSNLARFWAELCATTSGRPLFSSDQVLPAATSRIASIRVPGDYA